MKNRRLITISYTGLNAGGGVPKFNRDLHAAFPDRECVHYCWDDYPFASRPDMLAMPEWERARALNLYLIKTRSVTREDVVVADGFWAWGLESFPMAISHSHGIWGHVTWKDLQRGIAPENPFHHAAQIAFRGTWTKLGKRLTAVSGFIAQNMEDIWGFRADVINNGVDTDLWKPGKKFEIGKNNLPVVVHGVNDTGNLNKGWDHIEELKKELREKATVVSLDQLSTMMGQPKNEVMSMANICVHPSGYEGNSMFVAEALACGLPIVAYDVGFLWTAKGYDHLIGRVLERDWRSPWHTADAVKELLQTSAHERLRMGERARELAVDNLDIQLFRKNWRGYVDDVEFCHDT